MNDPLPSPILCYMPTYAPDTEAIQEELRPYGRQTNEQIADRINRTGVISRCRPQVYFDCIDSVLNVRPDLDLVVADARSTDSIRQGLSEHHQASGGAYYLALYPEKASQWAVFNDVLQRHAGPQTKYFVYTSSDIIWTMDWIDEAIKEFEKDPTLQILFPCVNSGDPALPIQIAPHPRDMDLIDPADHMDCPAMKAARAPCLNAYAMIFRMDFLKTYGGYPNTYLNCFTESFLYYMCEAMGGKMRLLPRGWLYHHNGIDAWTGEGGSYNYTAEKPKFDGMMDEVKQDRSSLRSPVCVEYFKKMLYT